MVELVLLQRVHGKVIHDGNLVSEHLLVREDPGSFQSIEGRSKAKRLQRDLTQSAVIHRRLLVRICHSELLSRVIEKYTSGSNWEQNGLTNTKQEGDETYVDDEGNSVVSEELRSRINPFKLHNGLGIGILLIARATRALINHPSEVSEEPE